MGYENNHYRDEDGETMMDFDEKFEEDQSDGENKVVDDGNINDFADDDGWQCGEQSSPSPVYKYNDSDFKLKPRKHLVKKSGGKGKLKRRRGGDDAEVKEMWNAVAGSDSEDDWEGGRMMHDDNFIDDTGVYPADRYHEPGSTGEEDDEVEELFKMGKKKKKNEKSAAEIALLVENVMAELEVVAEEDAELNRQSLPAINKLRKLPLLIEVLSKKQLQLEFLDHGVLTLLKNWLEPFQMDAYQA